MSRKKRVPKSRMHNPEGGGYKISSKVHKQKKFKNIEDKLLLADKITKADLKNII